MLLPEQLSVQPDVRENTGDGALNRILGPTFASDTEAHSPAGGFATPTMYEVRGRQYVVIACRGGKMGTRSGDAFVAFTLPRTG